MYLVTHTLLSIYKVPSKGQLHLIVRDRNKIKIGMKDMQRYMSQTLISLLIN